MTYGPQKIIYGTHVLHQRVCTNHSGQMIIISSQCSLTILDYQAEIWLTAKMDAALSPTVTAENAQPSSQIEERSSTESIRRLKLKGNKPLTCHKYGIVNPQSFDYFGMLNSPGVFNYLTDTSPCGYPDVNHLARLSLRNTNSWDTQSSGTHWSTCSISTVSSMNPLW